MIEFFPMTELPPVSEDPNFSKSVLIYDKDEYEFAEIGYYNFETKEWKHFGDWQLEMVCWSPIPNPEEWIKKNAPGALMGTLKKPTNDRKSIKDHHQS